MKKYIIARSKSEVPKIYKYIDFYCKLYNLDYTYNFGLFSNENTFSWQGEMYFAFSFSIERKHEIWHGFLGGMVKESELINDNYEEIKLF